MPAAAPAAARRRSATAATVPPPPAEVPPRRWDRGAEREPASRRRSRGLLIGVVVAILAGLGVAGFFALRDDDSSADPSDTIATEARASPTSRSPRSRR